MFKFEIFEKFIFGFGYFQQPQLHPNDNIKSTEVNMHRSLYSFL